MVSMVAYGPGCPKLDSQHSRDFFRGKIVDVPEFNQWRCLEKSGQWLENVDHTHLILASGKVLPKNTTDTRHIIKQVLKEKELCWRDVSS